MQFIFCMVQWPLKIIFFKHNSYLFLETEGVIIHVLRYCLLIRSWCFEFHSFLLEKTETIFHTEYNLILQQDFLKIKFKIILMIFAYTTVWVQFVFDNDNILDQYCSFRTAYHCYVHVNKNHNTCIIIIFCAD